MLQASDFSRLTSVLADNTSSKASTAKKVKSYEIDAEQLDYDFIGKCQDVDQLEAILAKLQSGTEGIFPDLEEFTLRRIKSLRPTENISEAAPMDLELNVQNSLQFLAEREKQKGNEELKAQDYKSALHFYTRSLSLVKQSHVYSNRSLCHLKMKMYGDSIDDATSALSLDKTCVKALLRRASAFSHRKQWQNARQDYEKSLELLESVNDNVVGCHQLIAHVRETLSKLPIQSLHIEEIES